MGKVPLQAEETAGMSVSRLREKPAGLACQGRCTDQGKAGAAGRCAPHNLVICLCLRISRETGGLSGLLHNQSP
jgi:hypothetical protein